MHKQMPSVIGAVTALFLATPVFAAGHSNNPATVVATVNGTDITVGHIAAAKTNLPQQYQSLADDVLFEGILEQLIQQTVLAETIKDVPQRAEIELANQRRNTLATVAVDRLVAETVAEEDIKAAYDAKYAGIEPEKEKPKAASQKAVDAVRKEAEEAKARVAALEAQIKNIQKQAPTPIDSQSLIIPLQNRLLPGNWSTLMDLPDPATASQTALLAAKSTLLPTESALLTELLQEHCGNGDKG